MGMDSNLVAMLASDISYAVSDVSSSLQFGRLTVEGTCGVIASGDNIDPEGILQTADIEFVAVRSSFGNEIPPVRSVVTVDGRRYYVQGAVDDGAAVTLQLKRGP
jgi:hypothetical protein